MTSNPAPIQINPDPRYLTIVMIGIPAHVGGANPNPRPIIPRKFSLPLTAS